METNFKIKSNKELKLLLLAAIAVTFVIYIVHLKIGLSYTREGLILGFIFWGICSARYSIINLLEC